jgi:hypothetical protein
LDLKQQLLKTQSCLVQYKTSNVDLVHGFNITLASLIPVKMFGPKTNAQRAVAHAAIKAALLRLLYCRMLSKTLVPWSASHYVSDPLCRPRQQIDPG